MILSELLISVELLREIMHKTALEKGISHPDVLLLSQILDGKLNEYEKIKVKGQF
ncbi:aspartyl-phosphate phosphatase Spo0E family protein [Dendrosporobacter sp. 1207_IL3150]|uniref:aspartyl-phosphate phosphatase Spo0E family protein n=1 Tax=Dendrosporobacter sp. 1207_IL3150 TaxID=3084054 RepID=UPI002FD94603